MGMVSECCCKEVYIYIIDILIIINTFPYSTCINSFLGSIIPISLFIFKCFFVLLYIASLQTHARTCRLLLLKKMRRHGS